MLSAPVFVGIDVARPSSISLCGPPTRRGRSQYGRGVPDLIARLRALAPTLLVLEATGGYETRRPECGRRRGAAHRRGQSPPGARFRQGVRHPREDRPDRCRRPRALCRACPPRRAGAPRCRHGRTRRPAGPAAPIARMLTAERHRLAQARPAVRRSLQQHIAGSSSASTTSTTTSPDAFAAVPSGAPRKTSCGRSPGSAPSSPAPCWRAPGARPPPASAPRRPRRPRPLHRDSGRHRGRRCIWGGRRIVRTALYMATLVATRHTPSSAPVISAS